LLKEGDDSGRTPGTAAGPLQPLVSVDPEMTPVPAPGYVLVVDDEPDVRESLAVLLDVCGIKAMTVANGWEALDLIRATAPPAVVLLDLKMPVMTGEQFLAERLADPALAAVPVVVSSATADTAVRARLPGVAAFHAKGCDAAELLATVRRLLAGG
jgi:CheY-like chemotaxis protein